MVNESPGMTLKAIGTVRNEVKEPPGAVYDWQAVVSDIVIDSSLTEALDNLDEFSHIIVIWWMHKAGSTDHLPPRIHPRGDQGLPLVGRFATRSPHRPNPLGEATVRLLQRRGNILKVRGLDAIDGTPVIDIKPYIPERGSVKRAKVPSWLTSR